VLGVGALDRRLPSPPQWSAQVFLHQARFREDKKDHKLWCVSPGKGASPYTILAKRMVVTDEHNNKYNVRPACVPRCACRAVLPVCAT
jgi:hypothetical protein